MFCSAYNIFYQVQRLRVLYGSLFLDKKDGSSLRGGMVSTTPRSCGPISPEEAQRAIIVSKNKPKRAHRKTKGMIGSKELNSFVTQQWKRIDPPSRQVLDRQAAIEKALYKEELRRWKKMQVKKAQKVGKETRPNQNSSMDEASTAEAAVVLAQQGKNNDSSFSSSSLLADSRPHQDIDHPLLDEFILQDDSPLWKVLACLCTQPSMPGSSFRDSFDALLEPLDQDIMDSLFDLS